MAKRKSKGESPFTYFRQLFTEHPDWLHQKSNDKVIAKYKEDHKLGEEDQIDKKIRDAMANTKSQMRKKQRDSKNGTTRKGRKRTASGSTKPAGSLVNLEENIDQCLSMARGFEQDELKQVIGHLRRARNELIWLLGEPG